MPLYVGLRAPEASAVASAVTAGRSRLLRGSDHPVRARVGILAAMSGENLALVGKAYELWNAGDFEGWVTTFLAPDVELDERYIAPDAAVYHGHEGVREWFRMGSDVLEA